MTQGAADLPTLSAEHHFPSRNLRTLHGCLHPRRIAIVGMCVRMCEVRSIIINSRARDRAFER